MGWWALLFITVCALNTHVDANKAALCLALAKLQLAQSSDFVTSSLQSKDLTYNDVFSKLLTDMTLTCYLSIDSEDFLEALQPDNAQALHPKMKELVPLPSSPYRTPEDITVSLPQQRLFVSLVNRVKADYQRSDNAGSQYR